MFPMPRPRLIPFLALALLAASYATVRVRRAKVGLEEAKLRLEPAGAETGSLAPGTEVEILGDQGEWSQVRVTGWVYRPALKDAGTPSPSRSPRPTETPFVPGGRPGPSARPIATIPPIAPDWTPTP